MNLKSLKIETKRFGPMEGKIIATVCIGHDRNEMTLELSEEASLRILTVACDELVSATATAAMEFREQLSAALLPSPENA
jgi:hypothetical protein